MPQIKHKRVFDYANGVNGLRQILWGLFKKIVIADNCALFADNVFNHSNQYSGSTLVLGAVFFAIQIYCDFSGYSDIAIGTARLFGIDLLRNFAFPYFSRDIAEFWRRWHISLSSWFRDYLYIPLGGSRGGNWMKVRNIFIIFIISGFWHGANWTFIIWGFLNALYIMPSVLLKSNRKHLDIVAQGKYLPSVKEFFSIVVTFGLTVFGWIFFRAENLTQAFGFISNLFSWSIFSLPAGPAFLTDGMPVYTMLLLLLIFFTIEWVGREQEYAIQKLNPVLIKPLRWGFYYVLILSIFIYSGKEHPFIYFQF